MLDSAENDGDNRVLFVARPDGFESPKVPRKDLTAAAREAGGSPGGSPGRSGGSSSPAPGAKSSLRTSSVESTGSTGESSSISSSSSSSSKKGNHKKGLGSKVGKSMKKAVAGMFRKRKTDYGLELSKLTNHLFSKREDGYHWPAELDFEEVEPRRVELAMTSFVSNYF